MQHFPHKLLGRIFFPQLVSAGMLFIQNCLAGIFFQSPPPHQKLNGQPLMPLSLLQVVNNLFQQIRNKRCKDNLLTTREQTCNNLCIFMRVPQPSTKDKK